MNIFRYNLWLEWVARAACLAGMLFYAVSIIVVYVEYNVYLSVTSVVGTKLKNDVRLNAVVSLFE